MAEHADRRSPARARASQAVRGLVAALGAALVASATAPHLTGHGLIPPASALPIASTDADAVPVPVLTEPPAGLRGFALWDSYYDLAPFGYEEQEYLVSGTARSAGGSTAPYTTRIIVFRPSDPADFRGTVLLDWVNVTAQFENAVDTMHAREMLKRDGYAYVHVSAQAAGLCCIPLTPKVWDPVRYAAIDHPGDEYAHDIFTQVARAFEVPEPADGGQHPMGALAGTVERILAAGQSQSANQLSSYLSSYLPANPGAVGVIDAVLVHGNVPGSKGFAVGSPVPVIQLLSDFEAVDDGVDPETHDPNYRLWEVAASGHSDMFIGYQSVVGYAPRITLGVPKLDQAGYRRVIDAAGNYGEVVHPFMAVCVVAGATMPKRYVTSAALHHLDAWAAGTGSPPNGPRFAFSGGGLATDPYGNTRGGIRLPPADVPVARYLSTACALGGLTVPFTDLELRALYGDHATYYRVMAERTDQTVADGFLLPDDAVDLMARACRAAVRFGAPPTCPAYEPPPFGQPLPGGSVPEAPEVSGDAGDGDGDGDAGAGDGPGTPPPAVPAGVAPAPVLPATGGAVPGALLAAVALTALVGRSVLGRSVLGRSVLGRSVLGRSSPGRVVPGRSGSSRR